MLNLWRIMDIIDNFGLLAATHKVKPYCVDLSTHLKQ